MMDFVQDMIEGLWHLPRGVKTQYKGREHSDNFQYYRRCGYAIYRTYYGPDADKYWNVLLDPWQTMLAFGFFEDDGPEEDVNNYVWIGDMGADGTGNCSEVRPPLVHYTGQDLKRA
ncbi:hypothetical protein FSPOR_11506 [Fusarium sporotrichioides]|uniref:Uncharacterized protein n=1 Tax=Fusarium sporotrichioides TaxID=5514 RepID=A0A395RGP5_FUSSP|nr:hypothetical protein FSPOR_11506 [Fusarium sporotrichioides]